MSSNFSSKCMYFLFVLNNFLGWFSNLKNRNNNNFYPKSVF